MGVGISTSLATNTGILDTPELLSLAPFHSYQLVMYVTSCQLPVVPYVCYPLPDAIVAAMQTSHHHTPSHRLPPVGPRLHSRWRNQHLDNQLPKLMKGTTGFNRKIHLPTMGRVRFSREKSPYMSRQDSFLFVEKNPN